MVSAILIAISAFFNAIMDLVSIKYSESIFSKYPKLKQFCDSSVSWRNKYKNGDPSQGPRFFGSTTFLVWTTDLWHLSKAIMLALLCSAIVFYTPIVGFIDILLYWLEFGICFELFYSKILKLKHD